MKRQIGSDGVLILDRPEKQIQVTHEGISTFLSYLFLVKDLGDFAEESD